jgi:hypothetical protein
MRFTSEATVPVAADRIDLADWLFTHQTSTRSCAVPHEALAR